MIILSQVEPIMEPLLESDYWYLPNRSQATTARVTSLLGYLQQRPRPLSSNRSFIPPFEVQNRYLQFFGLPQFQPNELEIKLDREQRQLIINGTHERNDEMEFECCTFFKRILLPNDVEMDQMKCFIADNGLLQIEAPINIKDGNNQQQNLPPTNFEQREVPIEIVQHQQQQNLNKESIDFGFGQPNQGDQFTRTKRRGVTLQQQQQSDQIDHGPDNQDLNKAERVIPIEMVGPRFQSPLMMMPDGQMMIADESMFMPTQREQLHAPIIATPIVPGSQAVAVPGQMIPGAFGPPPPGLTPIREIPIRVRKRPIDQGILCPCCNGRGSRHQHSQKHEHEEPVGTTQNNKKDYQPKNAATTTNMATAEMQQGSGIISQEDLLKAIEALQMVASNSANDSKQKK